MPMRAGSWRPFPVLIWSLVACSPGDSLPGEAASQASALAQPSFVPVLEAQLSRIDTVAAGIDSIFQPLPLLSPAEEEGLREFGNAAQLSRARSLGVGRELSEETLESLVGEGRLVRLADTEHYVIRDLDYSEPLAVPAVRDLLAEIGARFQARLADLGAPPFRLEITSVLRSAADQAALRQVNPNAALGESTHEYGTTVDVLYSAYSAPEQAITGTSLADHPELEPVLRRYAAIAAERVAARRALELKAILGEVLLELQREGRVMVTMERQQPVFHFTVAR
jgi:Family of unknown function (DUF5715)